MFPQGPKTVPNGTPNPLNSAKSAFQNAYQKRCGRSCANEVSQDPLQPQKLCSRQHGSIVFTFLLVVQKCSKMAPNDTFLAPFGTPNKPKVPQRTLRKNNNKSMRFLMPPGLENNPEITSKWTDVFLMFGGLGRSGCRLPPQCSPEGQKHPKITKKS